MSQPPENAKPGGGEADRVSIERQLQREIAPGIVEPQASLVNVVSAASGYALIRRKLDVKQLDDECSLRFRGIWNPGHMGEPIVAWRVTERNGRVAVSPITIRGELPPRGENEVRGISMPDHRVYVPGERFYDNAEAFLGAMLHRAHRLAGDTGWEAA
jgi:hypothetical protein